MTILIIFTTFDEIPVDKAIINTCPFESDTNPFDQSKNIFFNFFRSVLERFQFLQHLTRSSFTSLLTSHSKQYLSDRLEHLIDASAGKFTDNFEDFSFLRHY